MNRTLKGTGVAVITPFHKDGSIDFRSFEKVVNHIVNNGVDYIVTLGTTGEASVLNTDEKNAVINFVVEISDGRVPVVVGVGGNNTLEVARQFDLLNLEDATAVLSVCPFYNKPQQNGLYLHYKTIAQSSPLPVILYNVPDRTGVNLKPETTVQLANDFKNIIAIKEANRCVDQWLYILKHKPEHFMLISGDDLSTIPMIALGASGVISVTANAYPQHFSAMVKAALKNDYKTARKYQYMLSDFTTSLFLEGSPSGIKAAMDALGLCQNYLRLPNVPVSRSTVNTIKSLMSTVVEPISI